MLKNASLPATSGADTAENAPHLAEKLPSILPICAAPAVAARHCAVVAARLRDLDAGVRAEAARLLAMVSKISVFCKSLANFWRARSLLYKNEIL